MKALTKKMKQMIAFLLMFSVTIELSVQEGVAVKANEAKKEETVDEQRSLAPYIVGEEENLRTEYSKTFRQSDGTMLKIYSSTPLHRKENGVYENYNNSLKKVKKGNKNLWKNKRGAYEVSFPEKLGQSVDIEYKKYSLKMKMLEQVPLSEAVTGEAVSLSEASVSDVNNHTKRLEHKKQIEKRVDYSSYFPQNQGTISYANEHGSVVEYETDTTQIKENIRLDSKEAVQESYSYEIQADGLRAQKQEDGSILFFNKKNTEAIFRLEKPYMFDSAVGKAESYDVKVTLKRKGRSTFITYIPSKEWLFDEDRVYPVTIDPTISIGGSMYDTTEGLEGVCIGANSPNSRWRTSVIELGSDSRNAFLFKSNVIPEKDSVLLSAKLQIQGTSSCAKDAMVGVKQIESDCDLNTVTWNQKPNVSNQWMDYTGFDGFSYVSLDITPYIEEVRNTGKNNGVWFEWFQGGTASFWGMGGNIQMLYAVEFASLQKDDSELSKNDYTLGRSGTFTVFNATGYAQYECEDLTLQGNRMPVSIKRVYDGTHRNDVGMGGFRTNYHQKIVYREDRNVCEFYSEDGGVIEFGPDEDEAGDYKINWEEISSCDDYKNIVLTNPDGNTLHFDELGRLVEIRGGSQKVTSKNIITYINKTSDKISQITDGAGGRYQFVYSSENVSRIQYIGKTGDKVIKKVSYSYENVGENKVVNVNFPDKKTASCFFNKSGQLYQICDPSSRWLQMRYDAAGRMYHIWENGVYGTMGDRVTYHYEPMQTTISDENGNVNLIQFDRKGTVTGVRNQDGEAVVASTGESGALLGFSDVCSSAIGDNLVTSSEYYEAPYGDHPLTPAQVKTRKHDDSISVLAGKSYEEIAVNPETTTYTLRMTKSGSYPSGYRVTFGGWVKGNFQKGDVPTRGVTIELNIFYVDKTIEKKIIEPNLYVTDWQYVLHEIQLEKEAKRFSANLKLIRQANPVSISQLEIKCRKDEKEETETAFEPEVSPTSSSDVYGNVLYSKDDQGVETTSTYDDYGNLKSEKRSADQVYTVQSNLYKEGDLLTSHTDINGNTERYTYDDSKNCIRKDYDIGKILTYEYDDAGKVLSEKLYENEGQIQIGGDPTGEISYVYNAGDNLKKMESGNNVFNFTYTQFGDLSAIKHGTQNLVTYDYKSNSNRVLSKITYGNETGTGKNTISYTYNEKNQLTDDGQASYTYQKNGEIKQIQDRTNQSTTTWDGKKRTAVQNGILLYEYEEKTKGNCFRNAQGTQEVKTSQDSLYVTKQTISYNNTDTFQRLDHTDRLGHKTAEHITKAGTQPDALLDKSYEYRKIGASRVTDQIAKITTKFGNTTESEAITYDQMGNITVIKDQSGNETRYVYDKKGQLLRENCQKSNRTTVYQYDGDGNLTKKQEYAYTKNTLGTLLSEKVYTYGNAVWKDLLTEYDGQAIRYDSIGNPTTYRGRSLSWEKGRQLASGTKNGVTTKYQYDSNGIRTKKTVGNEEYTYTYVDDKLYAMKTAGVEMIFSYDSAGNPFSIWYNGNKYLYQTNLQGDVIGIIDQNGTRVAAYTYDAFGKLLSNPTSAVGRLNPLRYRGYVYDSDTGWYYLQSRYYDADTGRFLNADDPGVLMLDQDSMVKGNMFVYCLNNPVSMVDNSGLAAINVVCAAIGGVSGWFFGDYVARKLGYMPKGKGWWNAAKYWAIRAGIVVGGAVIGWFAGTLISKIVAAFLRSNPGIIFKIENKLSPAIFYMAMKFLGINPFSLVNVSRFIGLARKFNNKAVVFGVSWAKTFYYRALSLGYSIILHSPDDGYGWHFHVLKNGKKYSNLHIQLTKEAVAYFKGLLKY